MLALIAAAKALALPAAAQDLDAAAKAMNARKVATFDTAKLLKEPAIRSELQAIAGNRLRAIENALNVNGGVDYIGGALALAGNAPRQGGATGAIACIHPFSGKPRVHTTLLQGSKVSVFAREQR